MKKLFIILPLVLVLCFTFGCQKGEEVAEEPEPEEGVLSSEDEAALKKFLDEISQFVLASDWEALSHQYTEDAMFLPPNAPAFQGRESFLQMFEGVNITEHSHNLVEILGVCGDRIFGRGIFAWTMDVEGSPEPISQSGKWVVVIHKQLDGKLQIALHIWNLNPSPSE
ncbi:MAG: nuclear transport factor 2 family protein [Candidatus Aminicenantes bacterium]